MANIPVEIFDAKVKEVARRLPEAQRGDIHEYSQQIYRSTRHLLSNEWRTPPIGDAYLPESPVRGLEEYMAEVSRIVNDMAWADLQVAHGLDFPVPTAKTSIHRVKEAEDRAKETARGVGCNKALLMDVMIGFVGLHDSIVPLEAAARTRKNDRHLNTALDNMTRRILRPAHDQYLNWERMRHMH